MCKLYTKSLISYVESRDKSLQPVYNFHIVYLKVNTLGNLIIRIYMYLHKFNSNEQEISIPHEAIAGVWY